MKKLWTAPVITLMLLIPLGCGKVYNSSTFDAQTYAPPVTGGSAEFTAAKAILDSKCASCHTYQPHNAWAGWSEADFVSNGKVVANDLASSVLYTRLIGNRLGIGGQNMPDGGPGLSSAELDTIEAWIGSITP